MDAHTYHHIAVLLSLQYGATEAVELAKSCSLFSLGQPFDPNVIARLQHRPRVIHLNLCIGHVQVGS